MIDEAIFQDFIGNRKDLKKAMTPRAIERMRNKLERLNADGYDCNLLLERSIINGWQDVFPHESCLKKNQGFIAKITDISWAQGLRK